MDENRQLYTKCFNFLISNAFLKAHTAFSEAYYAQPQQLSYLFGIIISRILLNDMPGCLEFLEKEKNVSGYKELLRQILQFLKKNTHFTGQPVYSVIFNLGVFLKENAPAADIEIFFQTCQLLSPLDKKNLTALGEQEILKGNYRKGIKYFTQAAGCCGK